MAKGFLHANFEAVDSRMRGRPNGMLWYFPSPGEARLSPHLAALPLHLGLFVESRHIPKSAIRVDQLCGRPAKLRESFQQAYSRQGGRDCHGSSHNHAWDIGVVILDQSNEGKSSRRHPASHTPRSRSHHFAGLFQPRPGRFERRRVRSLGARSITCARGG